MRKPSTETKKRSLSGKERLKNITENPDGKATASSAVDHEQGKEGGQGALQEQQQAELERRREERIAREAAK